MAERSAADKRKISEGQRRRWADRDYRAKRAAKPKKSLDERLWARLQRGPETECWEWQGVRDAGGYGCATNLDGRRILAHRLAWVVTHGELPTSTVCVRHKCDNPPCCNPAHLELGSHADNARDKMERGRFHLKILSEKVVQAIRAADGSHYYVAAKFGLWENTVKGIREGKTYRHIPWDDALLRRSRA